MSMSDILKRMTDSLVADNHAERMGICRTCPRFVAATTTCLECGCFMKFKTKMKAAECPLGKW